METKYFSLPVEFAENKQYAIDDSLIPVDIKVMHNGVNLNNTYFSDEAIEDAKETLKNKPILGYIKKQDGSDNIDFGGHEFEVVLSDEGTKVIVLERPLGVVPETNNYAILEEQDKKYVFCRGYLWRDYLNEAFDVLSEKPSKSVSMEIAVDDYDVNDDGTINIKKYRYLGITILGDDLQPAMIGAELNVVGQFSKNNNEFYSKIEELNKKINEYFSAKDNDKGGESEVDNKIDDVTALFATYNQKREALRNALDPIIKKDEEGNVVEATYYYVVDFDDEYVYVERDHWIDGNYNTDYGRFTYNFNEATLEATITSEFEKMILVWLTEEEHQRIQEERNNYKSVIDEYNTLKEQNKNLQSEIDELKKYKENKELEEKQNEINQVFDKYSHLLDKTDYEDLIDKALELDISDLEKELSFRLVQKKFDFSKIDKKDTTKIIIKDNDTDTDPYGSASVYFRK